MLGIKTVYLEKFVYSDNSEGKYFDKSLEVQNKLIHSDRPIQREQIILILL